MRDSGSIIRLSGGCGKPAHRPRDERGDSCHVVEREHRQTGIGRHIGRDRDDARVVRIQHLAAAAAAQLNNLAAELRASIAQFKVA